MVYNVIRTSAKCIYIFSSWMVGKEYPKRKLLVYPCPYSGGRAKTDSERSSVNTRRPTVHFSDGSSSTRRQSRICDAADSPYGMSRRQTDEGGADTFSALGSRQSTREDTGSSTGTKNRFGISSSLANRPETCSSLGNRACNPLANSRRTSSILGTNADACRGPLPNGRTGVCRGDATQTRSNVDADRAYYRMLSLTDQRVTGLKFDTESSSLLKRTLTSKKIGKHSRTCERNPKDSLSLADHI